MLTCLNRKKNYRRGPAWLVAALGMLAWAQIFSGFLVCAKGAPAPATNWVAEATSHLGEWVWDSKTFDKQTCRLWNEFEIPRGTTVSSAIIHITVDNGYRLFLDGREIGRGSDWRSITVYDVKWLLSPGKHVLAVEGFNDRLAAGLIFGLDISLVDQRVIRLVSDSSWRVVPLDVRHWESRRTPSPDWHAVTVVGKLGAPPWDPWPYGITYEPTLQPITLYFWQTVWFQVLVLVLFGLAVLACLWLMTQLAVQSRAQRLLQLQRARIARDIHDDLGARLTQLVLLGELAQNELPAESGTRRQIDQICAKARELGHAMDEVVWAVSSRRDTLRDFATYVCKYAQLYLKDTPVRCRLDVEMDLPPIPFDLAIRRNLLLAVKEAISNVAKHSGASEVYLRIHRENAGLRVEVEDNGQGLDVTQADPARNGLLNMSQRMTEAGGEFAVTSAPGLGCRLSFYLPLTCVRQGPRWLRRFFLGSANVSELDNLPMVANREAELNETAHDET
jgi:signal transduction histidine kinase